MHKALLWIKVSFRRMTTPAFLVMLLISFVLWYGTKLSYTYRTDMRIPVKIGDTTLQVICTVEGIGSRLMVQKAMPRRHNVVISPDHLEFQPGQTGRGEKVVAPLSLQAAISSQVMDMRIISVKSRVALEPDDLK